MTICYFHVKREPPSKSHIREENKIKKMVAIALAAITMFGLPASLSTGASAASITEDKVIELEYPDFISNEDYYRTLAKEEGYILDIEVPEEYADEEAARIEEMSENTDAATFDLTRSQAKPTKKWNILTDGKYNLSAVNNVSVTLYSQYLFTGWTSYEVSIYNERKDNHDFTVKAYENKPLFDDLIEDEHTVKPGHTVIMYVVPSSDTAAWYLKFEGYSTLSGYVARDI